MVNNQKVMALAWHDWKIVDWNIKQTKQDIIVFHIISF